MKTLKPILFSTLLMAVFLSYTMEIKAQEDPVDYRVVQLTNQGNTIYTENTKDIKGSPLIKESFESGRILFEGNEATKIMPINYDSYKNQVLFIDNDQIKVLTLQNVRGFVFETPADFNQSEDVQEVYTYSIRHQNLGFTEKTPVQVYYDHGSPLKLFAVHQTHLIKGNTKDPFTGKVTDRYYNDTKYYLQTMDGELKEIKRIRDKDIIKALGKTHEKALKSYIKQNDLDGKSEKDMVKLLSYYEDNLVMNP